MRICFGVTAIGAQTVTGATEALEVAVVFGAPDIADDMAQS